MIKKNPHKNLYKQRLHVKKKLKKFLNSIKLFLLFSTEISSTEMSSTEISSTEMSSTEYRDVHYRVPRCPDTYSVYWRKTTTQS
jgi:hypothetical protein